MATYPCARRSSRKHLGVQSSYWSLRAPFWQNLMPSHAARAQLAPAHEPCAQAERVFSCSERWPEPRVGWIATEGRLLQKDGGLCLVSGYPGMHPFGLPTKLPRRRRKKEPTGFTHGEWLPFRFCARAGRALNGNAISRIAKSQGCYSGPFKTTNLLLCIAESLSETKCAARRFFFRGGGVRPQKQQRPLCVCL